MDTNEEPQRLETYRFSTRDVVEGQRFDTWSAEVSHLFHVSPLTGGTKFKAEATGRLLDNTVIGRASFEPQTFERNRRLASGMLAGSYLVQLYTGGGFQGIAGTRAIEVRSGDVCVFDLASTLATTAVTASSNITLIIPKISVDRYWRSDFDVNGYIFRRDTPMGEILAAHLSALERTVSVITFAEAPFFADSIARLLGSAFAFCMTSGDYDIVPLQKALFQRAATYIHMNLAMPNLTPDAVSKAINVSRAQLYRAFQQFGGIAHFIQDQRLKHAHEALRNPVTRGTPINVIASRCGFINDAHFSRLFRQVFGVSPRDARDAPPSVLQASGDNTLRLWLERPGFQTWR